MEMHVKQFSELSCTELYEIMRVRVAVFVVEQNCPYQDLDGIDAGAYHVFLQENEKILAYLRVFAEEDKHSTARIGRVLTAQRGTGLGAKILEVGIKTAKEKLCAQKIVLAAQSYAKGFYEKAGFRQTSAEFLEDGIPHVQMLLQM